MPVNKFDYLIVGQGIAGTTLAWHLLQRGKRVLIVDDPSVPSSSMVAAGIFNPLTGKKLVKTWLADTIFPYAHNFYTELEKKLKVRFLYDIPFFRPYRSIEEQNSYLAQSAEEGIAPYIDAEGIKDSELKYLDAPYGGLKIGKSGYVDLPVFLENSRLYFEQQQCFLETNFQVNDLKLESNAILWKELEFQKVVLCQGASALDNSYFDWLPFAPVKGQILEIESNCQFEAYIINQGVFMLPISSNRAKLGATYSWDPLDWTITESAKNELEEKFNKFFKADYVSIKQKAGIRPSVKDRRPLVGIHPAISNLGIFNGLGTKGVTLAPFFANDFVNHLEDGKDLNSFVNIKRYFSLYFH